METPAQRQPNVVVLGGGSWGTTIASICARRGPTLQWVRAEVTAQDITENHRNSRYLGNDVVLSETLRATTDFAEAADRADVIVMGVPSHGFRKVLIELASQLRPWVPVVSLVKGLEQGTNMRMSQIVEEVLARATRPRRCWQCPISTWPRMSQSYSVPSDFGHTPPTMSLASKWRAR
jgi:glycerol-3-phosphate dehydrogenase (NAD(P)+)